MAKVGGERWNLLLDVHAFAIPIKQRPNGEAMPEIVHAWPGTIAGASQPDLSGQAPEDAMDVLAQQAAALLGDEEGRATARSEMRIAPLGITAQRCTRPSDANGTSRDLPNLVTRTVSTPVYSTTSGWEALSP